MTCVGVDSPRFVGQLTALFPRRTGLFIETALYLGRQLALYGEIL
jgi:hypothetical protein